MTHIYSVWCGVYYKGSLMADICKPGSEILALDEDSDIWHVVGTVDDNGLFEAARTLWPDCTHCDRETDCHRQWIDAEGSIRRAKRRPLRVHVASGGHVVTIEV